MIRVQRGTIDERGNFVPRLAKILQWPRVTKFKVEPRRRRKVLGKLLAWCKWLISPATGGAGNPPKLFELPGVDAPGRVRTSSPAENWLSGAAAVTGKRRSNGLLAVKPRER
jgi:hypothetical protein